MRIPCPIPQFRHTLTALLLLLYVAAAQAESLAILEGERHHPLRSTQGMVTSSHPLATEAALNTLKQGGNAVDAAVVAGFVLAVVQPRSGNIGGGGFMLLAPGDGSPVTSIDYRETAPAGATRTMFQDNEGNVVAERSRFSHLASGVPGTVAGFALALEQHGTLSLADALAPAIRLAEAGFVVPYRFSEGLTQARDRLKRWPETARVYYKADGEAWQAGEVFRQPDLAATLTRIARHGAAEFYSGETAKRIAGEMARHGGLITLEDLQAYRPVVREPVNGRYRDYDIYSMAPPSSGGIHIIQILNLLEPFPIRDYGHNSAQTLHLMTEAMRLAYADRSKFLGDPDYVGVPLTGLTSKPYADKLRQRLNPMQATPSAEVGPGDPWRWESNETTHYSVVDRWGNAVSNTYTLNFSYGSGITVPGTGILLNNEMDDFSAKPGFPNAFGLIGGEANKVEPGKRMLSSMSPAIVRRDGRNLLVTGTPGGSRIITTTLQVIMNVIDHGMNIQSAVEAPRIHHQWLPDALFMEHGISPDTVDLLESRGHEVRLTNAMGAAQSIMIGPDGVLYGAADPRRSTSSAMGH